MDEGLWDLKEWQVLDFWAGSRLTVGSGFDPNFSTRLLNQIRFGLITRFLQGGFLFLR